MMTIIIIELFSFLFWTRGARLLMEDTRVYSEYKFVLDMSDFSEYPDVTVDITGYCKHQTRHDTETTVNGLGLFNECVYNYFVFEVYSEENYVGVTRKFMAIKNVESCDEEYRYSLPVVETDLPPGLNKIDFTVTRTGGEDCAPAPATLPPIADTRRLMEETSEYSEYKFVLDDSDFSEYPDVMVKITGYCKIGRDWLSTVGFTGKKGTFNECVYWSFIFKVYSGKNYLGVTRKFDAINNVESCNEVYGPYSLPVDQSDLSAGTNKITFTVTKSGGEEC